MDNGFFSRVGRQVGQWLGLGDITFNQDYKNKLEHQKDYYQGKQRLPLKLKLGQDDDNLLTNLSGLAVDRANAMLFGGGLEFEHAEQDSEEAAYLDAIWKANKKDKYLLLASNDGEISGTHFTKIVPDGLQTPTGLTHRLVLLDPTLTRIVCDPLDADRVLQYIWQVNLRNKTIREVTRRATEDDVSIDENGNQSPVDTTTWIVETWEGLAMNGRMQLVNSQNWPYDFPPILHGLNLPGVHSVYGVSGIENTEGPQDKYNQTQSNILKILRYHAHPKTWGKGISSKSDKLSWGADEIIKFSDPNAALSNLEMSSDLASSLQTKRDLRMTLNDLARVVDVQSYADKMGQMTNFTVRVLYSDAVAKNAVRRLLYGEFLDELNRRLLILGGYDGTNIPELHWGPDIPADEQADAALVLADLAAGLVSKETAAAKRGYVWDDGEGGGEKAKIANEQAAANQNNSDIGTQILRNFNKGQGVEMMQGQTPGKQGSNG